MKALISESTDPIWKIIFVLDGVCEGYKDNLHATTKTSGVSIYNDAKTLKVGSL